MTQFTLNMLETIIADRAKCSDKISYTASLVTSGMERAAKKMGEEAVETIIASLSSEKQDFINESADLLYHLLIMTHIAGVKLDDIMAELAKRTKQSGLEEKASRKNG